VRRESGDNWRNWSAAAEWRMSFFGVLMMVEENRAWVAIFCFIGCEKRRMNFGLDDGLRSLVLEWGSDSVRCWIAGVGFDSGFYAGVRRR